MSIITANPPQELLVVTYTLTGYSTSTASNGSQLYAESAATTPQPWGGNFTLGSRTSVEIEVVIPQMGLNVGSGSSFVQAHVMVDGSVKAQAYNHVAVANIDAFRNTIKFRQSGFVAGSTHSVAVQLQVSSSYGYVVASATNPGYIIVREL